MVTTLRIAIGDAFHKTIMGYRARDKSQDSCQTLSDSRSLIGDRLTSGDGAAEGQLSARLEMFTEPKPVA
jgi:hypothetical protein